ncbi:MULTISPECIES: 3-keto-disaccharide hydrolase [unclassified Saccharicrinis]|uniref:3-keto-disaccharide hydrolase n=1 Tax=unclassified Saccharicrinis TaxID=2646859 RepID=UPI003D325BD2
MKKSKYLLILFLTMFVMVCNADKNKPHKDYVALFNGEDLTGWETKNGTAPFKAVDGEIVGTNIPGTPNTFLCTKEKYGDFILTFDASFGEGNSGVMFRAQSTPDYKDGRVYGYQMEMDPTARGWTGGIYDEARRKWLYNMEYNSQAKSAFKKGQWNSYRIEAIGNHLRTYVNGVPMADLIDDVDASGFIGLQVHSIKGNKLKGQQVKFKNIFICTKNLDAHKTPENSDIAQVSFLTNQLTEKEQKAGWKLLWDGKTYEGWRGAKLDEFPQKGWDIKNGELMVESSGGGESRNGGDIVTTKAYENFILEVDFKFTKAGNSGIKYFVDTELNKGPGSSIGCEFQILDDDFHPDAKKGKNGNRTISSLYDLIPANAQEFNPDLPYKKLVFKYDWNRARVVVKGNDVEHYLNGILVVKYTRGNQEWRDLVAGSKYHVWPNFGERKKGLILLQDHGDETYFKNIKIKEL